MLGGGTVHDWDALCPAFSGVMTCMVISVRENVPIQRRGVSLGTALFLAWLGMGLGGWQGGLFFDITGDYRLSFANAAIAGILLPWQRLPPALGVRPTSRYSSVCLPAT